MAEGREVGECGGGGAVDIGGVAGFLDGVAR